MLARPSSAGTRAGAGDCQGVETPRTLVGAQKGAQKTTKYQKTSRDGAAQERVKTNRGGGGQEDRKWRQPPPPLGPAGTGPQFKDNRGEEWFEECWRKDRT